MGSSSGQSQFTHGYCGQFEESHNAGRIFDLRKVLRWLEDCHVETRRGKAQKATAKQLNGKFIYPWRPKIPF